MVLRKLLLLNFCVVWVLFSLISIVCFTSFGDGNISTFVTPRNWPNMGEAGCNSGGGGGCPQHQQTTPGKEFRLFQKRVIIS